MDIFIFLLTLGGTLSQLKVWIYYQLSSSLRGYVDFILLLFGFFFLLITFFVFIYKPFVLSFCFVFIFFSIFVYKPFFFFFFIHFTLPKSFIFIL
jgi:hypothetical protein